MKKIELYNEIIDNDNFVKYCLGGMGCPQIKKTSNSVFIKSSERPNEIISFSNKEWNILKDIIKSGQLK